MKFVIDKLEYQESLIIVTGRTLIGTIKGIWKYIKEPVVGKSYCIELNINNPEEVKVFKENRFSSVYLDNEDVIFTGLCEDIDSEVYYLRFAIDWLDMLDIEVIKPRKKKGDYISFSANFHDIEIYPYDYL